MIEKPRFASRKSVRALLILPLLTACGNLTAGGFGEAVVVVSADVASTITAVSAPAVRSTVERAAERSGAVLPYGRSAAAVMGPQSHDDHDHPEGELEVEFMAYLVTSTGESVPLSDEPVQIEVDLEGVEQDETLPRTVLAADYDQLRLVFLAIEAEVDAGLIINGEEVMGPIDVDFEGSLEVFKPIDLTVPESGRAEILIGLNAASWLQAVDPTTSSVDAAVFAQLIEISTR